MKKVILPIFIVILFFSIGFSQTSQIEKLKEDFKSASKSDQIKILGKLAKLYLNIDSKKSISYVESALKSAKRTKISNKLRAGLYNTLGTAYFDEKNFRKSLNSFEDELEIIKSGKSNYTLAKSYYNIAVLYRKTGKERKAETNYINSLKISSKRGYTNLTTYNYKSLYELYDLRGKTTKALDNLKKYIILRDKSFKTTEEDFTVLREQFEQEVLLRKETEETVQVLEEDTLKKSREIEYLNIEKEIAEQLNEQQRIINEKEKEIRKAELEKQKTRNKIMIGFIFVILIIAFVIFRSWQMKRKSNKILKRKNFEIIQQNEEIVQQREEITTQRDHLEIANIEITNQKDQIESTHKEIKDSINYASRIQTALLPSIELMQKEFSQYFIFNKPRDIVSGDFYWFTKTDNLQIIAVADCTGHGVPGAFVSMLGVSFLNEIINTSENLDAHKILEDLRFHVKESLHQTDTGGSKDGMDIALCVIDKETGKLQFSGAYNPLYIIKNNNDSELITLKSDRQPIGIHPREKAFTKKEFQLEKGDSLYMFSDGFVDQFGGEKGGKYKSRRFNELLLSINKNSMSEQKKMIEKAFNEWKGEIEQIDDVLIMGIKI